VGLLQLSRMFPVISRFFALPSISCRRHSFFRAVRLCIRPWSYTITLWTIYLTNRLWEFRQIYNLGAVGDKDELSRFLGQRSKVKVMTKPNNVQNGTFGILKFMCSNVTVTATFPAMSYRSKICCLVWYY